MEIARPFTNGASFLNVIKRNKLATFAELTGESGIIAIKART